MGRGVRAYPARRCCPWGEAARGDHWTKGSMVELDRAHFAAAEAAYAAQDWRQAALEYLTSVHGAPLEGTGRAYHRAGNSLVRLGRFADAVGVYRYALGDPGYDRHETVHV